MKKILAVILSVVTLVSMLSFSVCAEDVTGETQPTEETVVEEITESTEEKFDYFDNLAKAAEYLVLSIPASFGVAVAGLMVPPLILVTPLIFPWALVAFFAALFGQNMW